MSAIVWGNIRPTDAVRVVTDRSPYQQGRDEERAAIVAWLRRQADGAAEHGEDDDAGYVRMLADEVETGEHVEP